MDDLVAAGLIERPQKDVSPCPSPDNYIYVPTVTFYKMPEPLPLSLPLSRIKDEPEDKSKGDTSEDA